MFIEVNMIKGTDYYISNSKRSLEFEFMGFQNMYFFYYVYKNIFVCIFILKKFWIDVNKVYSIPDFQFSRKLYNRDWKRTKAMQIFNPLSIFNM